MRTASDTVNAHGAPEAVSAVVINHNGGRRVLGCLEALASQAVPLAAVAVVDNGSADGSVDAIRARFPDVTVHALGRNLGLPAARNRGLDQAPTALVLLLDDDVYVAGECVRRLLRACRDQGAAAVCPRVRLHPQRKIVQADGAAAHFTGTMLIRHAGLEAHRAPRTAGRVGACIGACMLVDRSAVLAAGGFDELYFFYFEDLEFSLRLRARGHRIVCEPAAEVFHDRGRGTPGLSFRGRGPYPRRRAYLTMRHRLLTILIHYRTRTIVMLFPALVLYELATLTLALLRGWTGAWTGAWRWVLRNTRTVLKRRRRSQRARVVADRDLLTGGPVPLATGVVQSAAEHAAVAAVSVLLNAYWSRVRRWIG
jgi:GT2 family glycosyltransferase